MCCRLPFILSIATVIHYLLLGLSASRSNGVAPLAPELVVVSVNLSCVELGWSAHRTGGGPVIHYLLSYR